MADSKEQTNFWVTLPGILTGIAGVITALGGIYISSHSSTLLKPPIQESPSPQISSPISNSQSSKKPGDDSTTNTNKCQSSRVNRDYGLYLYSTENGGEPIIAILPYNTPVSILKTNRNGWAKIAYQRRDGNTGEGWVASASLTCDI